MQRCMHGRHAHTGKASRHAQQGGRARPLTSDVLRPPGEAVAAEVAGPCLGSGCPCGCGCCCCWFCCCWFCCRCWLAHRRKICSFTDRTSPASKEASQPLVTGWSTACPQVAASPGSYPQVGSNGQVCLDAKNRCWLRILSSRAAGDILRLLRAAGGDLLRAEGPDAAEAA